MCPCEWMAGVAHVPAAHHKMKDKDGMRNRKEGEDEVELEDEDEEFISLTYCGMLV